MEKTVLGHRTGSGYDKIQCPVLIMSAFNTPLDPRKSVNSVSLISKSFLIQYNRDFSPLIVM